MTADREVAYGKQQQILDWDAMIALPRTAIDPQSQIDLPGAQS